MQTQIPPLVLLVDFQSHPGYNAVSMEWCIGFYNFLGDEDEDMKEHCL